MDVLPISHRNINPLEDAHTLVEYLEHLLKTPRAIVSVKHLAQLGYLADCSEILITKQDYQKSRQLISLHDYDYANLVELARERVDQGLVPSNWLEEFKKSYGE